MRSEIGRLFEDIENSDQLQADANELGTDPEAFMEWARQKGYDFSLADLCSHAKAELGELSDEELEAVAGGMRGLRGSALTTGRRRAPALNIAILKMDQAESIKNKHAVDLCRAELLIEAMRSGYMASDA